MGGGCNSVSGVFSEKMIRLSRSWSWIHDSFASDWEKLSRSDLLLEKGPSGMIWSTKQKFVLKVHTPEGRVTAYKSYRYIKHPQAYLFRASPTGLEEVNYAALQQMGFPMAKLLAVGETRNFFVIKTAFLVTEFVESSLDGTAFLPGKEYAWSRAYLEEFCTKNLALLAKLHNHGMIHNGAAPYNMLWKEKIPARQKEGDSLEITWIDVATCRKCVPGKRFIRKAAGDLEKFLTPFAFSREETSEWIRLYCSGVDYAEKEALCKTLSAMLLH